jgi:hypothetical protein
VVAFYGIALVVAAVALAVKRSPSPKRALAWTGGAAALVAALCVGLCQEGRLLAAIGAGARGGDPTAASFARPAASTERASDPEQVLQQARQARGPDGAAAAALLLPLLEAADTPLYFREQALELLRQLAQADFGYRVDEDPARNAPALARIRAWIARPAK